jgi:hypothetical protein
VVVGVAIYSYRTERLFVGAIVLGLIVGAIWFVAGAYTLFAIVANGCLS